MQDGYCRTPLNVAHSSSQVGFGMTHGLGLSHTLLVLSLNQLHFLWPRASPSPDTLHSIIDKKSCLAKSYHPNVKGTDNHDTMRHFAEAIPTLRYHLCQSTVLA
jgi:hypothetical protein